MHAATGWDISVAEALQIGERAVNLARVSMPARAFARTTPCPTLFAPLENGALQGSASPAHEFDATMTELYRIKGWDTETAAHAHPLAELGIGGRLI